MDVMNLRRHLLLNVYHGGALPSAYQRVSYLEATGTQYINTGVDLSNEKDIYIEVDFEVLASAASDNAILCGQTQTLSYGAWKLPNWCDKNIEVRGYGISNNGVAQVERGVRTKLTFDYSDGEQKIYKDGSLIRTNNNSWQTGSDFPLHMFVGKNVDVMKWYAKARIYNVYIRFGSAEIRNFIPCYRKSDNVAGMYDLVNGVFYTNDGTGSFNIGSDV